MKVIPQQLKKSMETLMKFITIIECIIIQFSGARFVHSNLNVKNKPTFTIESSQFLAQNRTGKNFS